MKKLASIGLVGLLGMLLALCLAPAAQAYPAVQFDVNVSTTVVHSGDPVVGSATANVACTWKIEWNNRTRTGDSQQNYSTRFLAPEVSTRTVIPMHFTCGYAATGAARAAAATWQRTIDVTVLPDGTRSAAAPAAGASDLPNTGGPNVLFLLAGLGLLVAGATAVSVARRRNDDLDPIQI